MPPKLMAPERRPAGHAGSRTRSTRSRSRGRRCASLAWRGRGRTRRSLRELKLLVDHRDDIVDERRRPQQRLRWHLHQLDPTFVVPLRNARPHGPSGARRPLARRQRAGAAGAARARARQPLPLADPRRSPSSTGNSNSGPLRRAPALLELPGCGPITAAKLLAEIGPIERFKSDAQLARHSGVAPLEASSGRIQRHRLDRGGNRQLNAALYRIAITQARFHPGRTRLPRTQTSRRQEPPRSDPLPQTTPRPHRLQHTQSEPRLDIGATLAPTTISVAPTSRMLGRLRLRRCS